MSSKEISVEKFLIEEAKLRGGFTVKLNPAGNKGIPDRLVVLPGGNVMFVELKRPKNGVIAKLQRWWRSRILRCGAIHYYAKTKDEVLALLSKYE